MGILDFIFPKFCVNCKRYGDFLCPDCFILLSFEVKNICGVCSKPAINGETHPVCKTKFSIDGVSAAVKFNPVSKKLIYSFKYRPFLSSLKCFLGELFYESIIQKEELKNLLQKDLIIIPIPITPKKLRKRGYNQAQILAKEVSEKLNLNTIDALIRVKETKTQVSLSREERRKNLNDAFVIRPKYKDLIKNSDFFILDDVVTTGATFNEAASVLKKAGAKSVWGIAFAKED